MNRGLWLINFLMDFNLISTVVLLSRIAPRINTHLMRFMPILGSRSLSTKNYGYLIIKWYLLWVGSRKVILFYNLLIQVSCRNLIRLWLIALSCWSSLCRFVSPLWRCLRGACMINYFRFWYLICKHWVWCSSCCFRLCLSVSHRCLVTISRLMNIWCRLHDVKFKFIEYFKYNAFK